MEGGALAVYLEMDDKDKLDVAEVKQSLMRAFADSKFVAFSKLKQARLGGESVDLSTLELRKLA